MGLYGGLNQALDLQYAQQQDQLRNAMAVDAAIRAREAAAQQQALQLGAAQREQQGLALRERQVTAEIEQNRLQRERQAMLDSYAREQNDRDRKKSDAQDAERLEKERRQALAVLLETVSTYGEATPQAIARFNKVSDAPVSGGRKLQDGTVVVTVAGVERPFPAADVDRIRREYLGVVDNPAKAPAISADAMASLIHGLADDPGSMLREDAASGRRFWDPRVEAAAAYAAWLTAKNPAMSPEEAARAAMNNAGLKVRGKQALPPAPAAGGPARAPTPSQLDEDIDLVRKAIAKYPEDPRLEQRLRQLLQHKQQEAGR